MSAAFSPPLESPQVLRLWADDYHEQPTANPPPRAEYLRENSDHLRSIDPQVVWPLREALSRLRNAWPHSRKECTWKQYEIIQRYWERFFGSPGPCLTTIGCADLQAFFEATEEWATIQSWERNSSQLSAIFRSLCRQTRANSYGLPREVKAPFVIDDIPWVDVHEKIWFKENRDAGWARIGGHMPMRRSTITLDDFQKVIDGIWTMPGLGDRVWWETLLAWIWFSGMRITQLREELPWCMDGRSEGIDLASKSVVTDESKCGGEISIPLPDCLMPGFETLWLRPKPPDSEGLVFFGPGHQSAKWFYVAWPRIWEHAFPCTTDAERATRHFNPHQLRAVSVTNWDLRPAPDNALGHLITGHSAGDVRQAAYFQPGDQRMREIVNRFPMPRLRTPRPLFA